ncbi:ribonuclease H-like protein [Hirsutella rhossiliensis]|uniref:Ribonuclease H-like protein n=1 Tax=Hirsutella rhossiliensis TaxID=111463 RepID=A0A9P8SES0_9HYPO|nr:Ribonuclease H-like protein [Hirsutella rhossiliensis]KAH0959314.1 Ribonuclease H-like protein [Hirsutella rhossiliensis]
MKLQSTTESSPCTSACGEPFREEQFVTLLPILRDFVSTYLKEEGVKWDPEVHRLRCLGHVINLAVQAFLFQNSIDLKEGEICEDADDLAKFKGSAPNFAALDHLGISLDNRTRWNSWYQMLHVATQQETASALDTYTKNHFEDLSADFLLPEDWARLRIIEKILQPFARATLATQGDHATLDKVLFTMDVLIRCFDEALVTYKSDTELSFRIKRGWEVFDKYYSKTEASPYYAAALILHPSYRTTYIQANWKKKWQKPAFKQVKDLWLTYRDTVDGALSQHLLDDDDDEDLDAFDRISRNLQNCTRPSSQDEYEDYISCDPHPINAGDE